MFTEFGNPLTQADMLRSISPYYHSETIRKPLIVLQGGSDRTVKEDMVDRFVERVRKNNIPLEYIVFPKEGHGFTRKESQIEGYGAMMVFLDRYLKRSIAETAPEHR
jgi:dipeptidyl aminopeptidase/acylaminoacyl peptidase